MSTEVQASVKWSFDASQIASSSTHKEMGHLSRLWNASKGKYKLTLDEQKLQRQFGDILFKERLTKRAKKQNTTESNICRICGIKILMMCYQRTGSCCVDHEKMRTGEFPVPEKYIAKKYWKKNQKPKEG